MRRSLGVLFTLALLLGGFVACGGDDDDEVGADANVDKELDLDELDDGDVPNLAGMSGDCKAAVTAMASVSAGAGSIFSGGDTDLDKSMETFRAFADEAPDEIRDDVETLADAYGKFIDVLRDIDYDPSSGKAPPQEFMDAAEEMGTDKISEAGERVSAYFDEHCGTSTGND